MLKLLLCLLQVRGFCGHRDVPPTPHPPSHFPGELAPQLLGMLSSDKLSCQPLRGLSPLQTAGRPRARPLLWEPHLPGRYRGLVSSVQRATAVKVIMAPVFPVGSVVGPHRPPLPSPVSLLPPPQGMVPVTLLHKHPVPKLFSEPASWEALPVPAPTSPLVLMTAPQRLAEWPARGGSSSLSYTLHDLWPGSGFWTHRHLGPRRRCL